MAPVRRPVSLLVLSLALVACRPQPEVREATTVAFPPAPAGLESRLSTYLAASRSHERNVWRDSPPLNPDGTANGYIEISRGESTKWEFRIELNRREIDRMVPPDLGGYPTNYGFLPRTISYDGDPADVLVLGPPLEGGSVARGRIVALMMMVDSGDLDSKVVVSPLDANGRATHTLEAGDRDRLERFFNTYKNHEGKVTKVTGWEDAEAARNFIGRTAGFFDAGRQR